MPLEGTFESATADGAEHADWLRFFLRDLSFDVHRMLYALFMDVQIRVRSMCVDDDTSFVQGARCIVDPPQLASAVSEILLMHIMT